MTINGCVRIARVGNGGSKASALPSRALAWSRLRPGLIALSLLIGLASPALAQQAVRIPLPAGSGAQHVNATLQRPAQATGRLPAVMLLHGCGGIGQNHARMARHLAQAGYVTLLIDSFSSRGIRDACTRNWPSAADARERTRDIDAALAWLAARPDVAAERIAAIGYSYGGGVLLLHQMPPQDRPAATDPRLRAAIAVYPDCALVEAPRPTVRAPLFMAMAERDDWTPVSQCTALLERVGDGRKLVETTIYPGAHHSFDAVGLAVTYLAAAGNRSKPNNCCGAHYGYHEPAWRQFIKDVDAFLARQLGTAR